MSATKESPCVCFSGCAFLGQRNLGMHSAGCRASTLLLIVVQLALVNSALSRGNRRAPDLANAIGIIGKKKGLSGTHGNEPINTNDPKAKFEGSPYGNRNMMQLKHNEKILSIDKALAIQEQTFQNNVQDEIDRQSSISESSDSDSDSDSNSNSNSNSNSRKKRKKKRRKKKKPEDEEELNPSGPSGGDSSDTKDEHHPEGSNPRSGNEPGNNNSTINRKKPLLRRPDSSAEDEEIPERKGDAPASQNRSKFPPDNRVKCPNINGCVPEITPTVYGGPFKKDTPPVPDSKHIQSPSGPGGGSPSGPGGASPSGPGGASPSGPSKGVAEKTPSSSDPIVLDAVKAMGGIDDVKAFDTERGHRGPIGNDVTDTFPVLPASMFRGHRNNPTGPVGDGRHGRKLKDKQSMSGEGEEEGSTVHDNADEDVAPENPLLSEPSENTT